VILFCTSTAGTYYKQDRTPPTVTHFTASTAGTCYKQVCTPPQDCTLPTVILFCTSTAGTCYKQDRTPPTVKLIKISTAGTYYNQDCTPPTRLYPTHCDTYYDVYCRHLLQARLYSNQCDTYYNIYCRHLLQARSYPTHCDAPLIPQDRNCLPNQAAAHHGAISRLRFSSECGVLDYIGSGCALTESACTVKFRDCPSAWLDLFRRLCFSSEYGVLDYRPFTITSEIN